MTVLGGDDSSRYLRITLFGCLGSWLLWGGLFVLAVTLESNALLDLVLGETAAFLLFVLLPAGICIAYVYSSFLTGSDEGAVVILGLVVHGLLFGIFVSAPLIPFTIIVSLGSACGLYALFRLFGMYGVSYAGTAVFTGVALRTVVPLVVYLLATSIYVLTNRASLALADWSGRVIWTLILIAIIANSLRYRGQLRMVWTRGRDQNQEPPNTPAVLPGVEPAEPETTPVVHLESVIHVLSIVCPGCSGRLALDECFVGHRIVCPKCGTPFMIDSP